MMFFTMTVSTMWKNTQVTAIETRRLVLDATVAQAHRGRMTVAPRM